MEITYRTKKAGLFEGAQFYRHIGSNELAIVRRNLNDFSFGGRGVTYTLTICDSLTLQAQDFWGHEGPKIWRNR